MAPEGIRPFRIDVPARRPRRPAGQAQSQFITEIDGQPVHFLHVRCGDGDAVPLILTHGWPGSIIEYLDLIRPLTEPGQAGGQAFDLVIPSLPGFGFCGPARSPGGVRSARRGPGPS